MSIPLLIAISCVEIIGDFGLKSFANDGGISYLGVGLTGYIGVISLLIYSLQDSSILLVNSGWDAMSSIIETLAAFIFLGERFDHYMQYVGIVFIVVGIYFLKIPAKKNKAFHMPKLF